MALSPNHPNNEVIKFRQDVAYDFLRSSRFDAYMGDDPEGVKRGLRKAFLKHLREREFDHLLFAHGAPWIGGARAGLHAFLDRLER